MATIASLLRERVTLQVRSVDRVFLAGYVPKLQSEGLVVRFLLDRGFPIPSPAALGKISQSYVRAVDRFAAKNKVPVVRFKKGEIKEQTAREYMQKAEREGRFGVVLIGVAQERASAWRGYRAGGPDSHPHFCYRRMSVFPNYYYFYIRDRDFGPGFVKTIAYAPWPVWIYLNGHEWAKRQATMRGMSFEALDNGFRSVDDEVALAGVCDSLGVREIERFWHRWESLLPSPFTAEDRLRGYRYALSIRQLEISDTRVFDQPAACRAWFEQMITDQLTLGRPDQVQITFARKITSKTPGRFRTRVVHRGVEPQIQAHYKHSKVKQYLKEGRALRTETTINDPYDFGVGRLLTAENWQALTTLGNDVNQRLMSAELKACDCAPDPTTLQRVVSPSTQDGQKAPALHFGDPRVMALLSCLCSFTHLIAGLTNRTLREQIAELIPGYSRSQMTYDLRRLRRKGLIRRVPKSQRYELTEYGRTIAVFFTKTYVRILNPSLAELDPTLPDEITGHHPLARHWRAYEHALDQRIKQASIMT
ncbi:MAG: winged helix-turn-helix transcriptional regulator [Actinomycetota bacterium]|nr:winged helix-turn-helix transcriptional regulator [Actinomycetota bacterium]